MKISRGVDILTSPEAVICSDLAEKAGVPGEAVHASIEETFPGAIEGMRAGRESVQITHRRRWSCWVVFGAWGMHGPPGALTRGLVPMPPG